MRGLTLFLLFAGLCGCAGPVAEASGGYRSPERQINDALAKGIDPAKIRVCDYEEVTGSRLRTVTCRYLNEKERDQAGAQLFFMRMQQMGANRNTSPGNPPNRASGGGG